MYTSPRCYVNRDLGVQVTLVEKLAHLLPKDHGLVLVPRDLTRVKPHSMQARAVLVRRRPM